MGSLMYQRQENYYTKVNLAQDPEETLLTQSCWRSYSKKHPDYLGRCFCNSIMMQVPAMIVSSQALRQLSANNMAFTSKLSASLMRELYKGRRIIDGRKWVCRKLVTRIPMSHQSTAQARGVATLP